MLGERNNPAVPSSRRGLTCRVPPLRTINARVMLMPTRDDVSPRGRPRWFPLLLVALSAVLVGPLHAAPPDLTPKHAEEMARSQELFTRQVRKLFLDKCLKCHGGDKTKGELDLATREGLLKGGSHGPAVVVGKGKGSRLYKMIAHEEDPPMPANAPKLSDEQIASVAAWIDLGAAYDKPLIEKAAATAKKALTVTDEDRLFWSFQPLRPVTPPPMKDEAWVRTFIDRFVLARLEEKGIAPNPTVERRRLIRRAYFDLIGLPPPAAEVEAFVNDPAPDAYDRLIDRLLDDPHFGERWARHWLDIARFAESHGFEHDYDRPNAYHYRDFVIKAFNRDLPYDTFVKWQLAGDEYEPHNPLALMATGFLAAGVHSTQITKNQVEKERYDELDDMARTTGTAMLGLTIGCARCHDHKYDPIPTKDYYRLLATFTTTVRSDYEIDLDPAGYRLAKAKFDAEHARVAEPLQRFEKVELPGALDRWLATRGQEPVRPRWTVLDLVETKSKGEATWTRLDDGSYLAGGKNPDFDTYTFVAHTQQRGITAVRLDALAHPSFVKGGPGRAGNGNFALSDFRVTAAPLAGSGQPVAVKLVNPRATFEQKGLPVAAAIDADKKSAWAVDPQFGKDHAAVFEVEGDLGFEGGMVLTFTLEFNNNNGHNIGRPRLSVSTEPRPVGLDGDVLPLKVAEAFAALDKDPAFKPSDEQRTALLTWYRTRDAKWMELNKVVEEHAKGAPKPTLTKALISSEGVAAVRLHTQGGDFLEQTHFLKRGDPNQKDGVAEPGYLQVLMRSPDQEKHWQVPPPPDWRTSYRRRALAEWITDVDGGAGHLLARVIVNRLWQHHLGRGLVATPSDFGQQGERPTHPELLDWLAGELIRNGWRLKPIHKLIMTSAVYMQGGEFDKQRAAVDAENRLLWRRAPRRLEAEVIRDSLLAVSGSLDPRMFGPGTLDVSQKRRSIYFFVKRSQLVPTMVLFDAPDALLGLEQRSSTTIAPQALMLMNNAIVRGYADGFARRIAPAEGKSLDEAVRSGYQVALGRQPSERELAESVQFVRQQMESYKVEQKKEAQQLALGDFCQVLMSLNEFVYVD
jgi:mono/diheme cytochrome c family protein